MTVKTVGEYNIPRAVRVDKIVIICIFVENKDNKLNVGLSKNHYTSKALFIFDKFIKWS